MFHTSYTLKGSFYFFQLNQPDDEIPDRVWSVRATGAAYLIAVYVCDLWVTCTACTMINNVYWHSIPGLIVNSGFTIIINMNGAVLSIRITIPSSCHMQIATLYFSDVTFCNNTYLFKLQVGDGNRLLQLLVLAYTWKCTATCNFIG